MRARPREYVSGMDLKLPKKKKRAPDLIYQECLFYIFLISRESLP